MNNRNKKINKKLLICTLSLFVVSLSALEIDVIKLDDGRVLEGEYIDNKVKIYYKGIWMGEIGVKPESIVSKSKKSIGGGDNDNKDRDKNLNAVQVMDVDILNIIDQIDKAEIKKEKLLIERNKLLLAKNVSKAQSYIEAYLNSTPITDEEINNVDISTSSSYIDTFMIIKNKWNGGNYIRGGNRDSDYIKDNNDDKDNKDDIRKNRSIDSILPLIKYERELVLLGRIKWDFDLGYQGLYIKKCLVINHNHNYNNNHDHSYSSDNYISRINDVNFIFKEAIMRMNQERIKESDSKEEYQRKEAQRKEAQRKAEDRKKRETVERSGPSQIIPVGPR
jgi:hypothetical protein